VAAGKVHTHAQSGGKKKKKSWNWFCRKKEYCKTLELGFVEETLISRRIV
jgi:hypothetical protein